MQLLSITNLRLEILINILKNSNIINIKRKLLEILTFHLYYENPDYFELKKDYEPSINNLKELEEMIKTKLTKDKKNVKISKDLKTVQDLMENIEIKQKNSEEGKQTVKPDIKENDENKEALKPNNKVNNKEQEIKEKKDIKSKEKDSEDEAKKNINIIPLKKSCLLIAKNFLDYYKGLLNNPVHISENTANFYLLPRCMFNSEIETNKYLFDLESFLSENKGNNKGNIEIIGLNKNKQIKNIDIYNNEKYLDINEALKILFSFNSSFNNIESQTTKIINKNKKDFIKNMKEVKEFYKDIFLIDIKTEENEKCNNFEEGINEQINKYVDDFENEVLSKLNKLNETLFEGKIDNKKKNIIYYQKKFFSNFLSNYSIYFLKKSDYPDLKKLLYFLNIRILILNKIIKYFEDYRKKFLQRLISEEKEYNEIMTKVKSNLKQLKASIEKNYNFEEKNNAYEKWRIKYISTYKDIDIDKISSDSLKRYFRENIKLKLNLEMNFTYDAKFCLWAIKNKFGEYFMN